MTILTTVALVAMLTIASSAIALHTHPRQREHFGWSSNNSMAKHCLSLSAAAFILVSSPCMAMEDKTKMTPLPLVPVLLHPNPVTKETKETKVLRNLEDRRLSECEGRGDKWEECFFYGIGSTIDSTGTRFLRPKSSAIRGVPTW